MSWSILYDTNGYPFALAIDGFAVIHVQATERTSAFVGYLVDALNNGDMTVLARVVGRYRAEVDG